MFKLASIAIIKIFQKPFKLNQQKIIYISLRSLLLLAFITAISTGHSFAASTYYQHHARHYKGEMMPMPAALPQCTFCPHYAFGGGFYAGLEAGIRTNYSSNPSVYKGLEGTILGGYGALVTPLFYLAGEIFAGDSINLQNYKAPGFTNGVKSSWTLGLSVLPGYVLTENVMGYLRAGVVRTHFPEMSGTATGGQFGVGLQTAIYRSWDLRGEYIYNFYQQLSATPVGNVKSDQFNLGLIYKFL